MTTCSEQKSGEPDCPRLKHESNIILDSALCNVQSSFEHDTASPIVVKTARLCVSGGMGGSFTLLDCVSLLTGRSKSLQQHYNYHQQNNLREEYKSIERGEEIVRGPSPRPIIHGRKASVIEFGPAVFAQ